MPIRFDEGSGGGSNNNNNNFGRGGRNGNNRGGMAILLMILFFVFRRPKIGIPLLVIGGIVFWLAGGMSALNGEPNSNSEMASLLGFGAEIDQDKYDKAEVFEPLAVGSNKYSIPKRFSLRKYAPRRKSQGQQGSCVGWASAYAARSIVEAVATGKNPDNVAFSPSFLYNQIALPNCQGSYTSEALRKMKNDGLVFFSKFPYDQSSCSKRPSNSLLQEAKRYRIRGYNRLSISGGNYDVNMDALKQNIAQGAPAVIAMHVPESFYYVNGELWTPKRNDYNNIRRLGGHAMCAIGYDDNKFGGAFEVMNSWGDDWGDDGVFWIRYSDFRQFVREAYGLYPHPQAKQASTDKFEVEFGLVDANNNRNIPLKQVQGNLFQTRRPISKGDKFKIEVTNEIECYIYVFGQETNGSSYVLFPYIRPGQTESKYSPYCGIVGTRNFPSGDASLVADKIGTKDFMAVVVSKEELNYKDLNRQIDRASGRDYISKLNRALGTTQISNPNFKTGNTIAFKGKTRGNQKVVGVVIEIDKR